MNSTIGVFMLGMLISGTLNTLLFKCQDKQVISGQDFSHPFMQTFSMFLGESLCFLIYFIQKKWNPQAFQNNQKIAFEKGLKTSDHNGLLSLFIPAFADFCTTFLQFIGLELINASIYQILRGGVIIVTAFFSVLFLKKKLNLQKYLGIFLAVLGTIIVGISVFIRKGEENTEKTYVQMLGISLVILSLITNGIIFVAEEKIFSIYYLETLQVVGMEGIWGMAICSAFLPFFHFFPINQKIGILYEGKHYIERIDVYFNQISKSSKSLKYLHLIILALLLTLCIAALLTISLFNYFGVSITKNVSALSRSILDVARTALIWIIGLFIVDANGPWEEFNFLQLCGFLTLILGTFIYNDILVIIDEKSETSADIEETNELMSNTTKSSDQNFHVL